VTSAGGRAGKNDIVNSERDERVRRDGLYSGEQNNMGLYQLFGFVLHFTRAWTSSFWLGATDIDKRAGGMACRAADALVSANGAGAGVGGSGGGSSHILHLCTTSNEGEEDINENMRK